MNFKKIMFIFFVLSVALAWNRNHFVLCKFSQVILNMSEKHVILESNRGCVNDLLQNSNSKYLLDKAQKILA